MNGGLVPESNLMFGWVDIYINISGRNRKKKYCNRITPSLQETSVGLKNRMMKNPVTNKSPIHESVQMRTSRPAALGFPGQAGQLQAVVLTADRKEIRCQRSA